MTWNPAIHKRRRDKGRHPYDGLGLNPRLEGTGIEITMKQILGTLGVEQRLWFPQFKLPEMDSPYSAHDFDFAIPSCRLLIECDGCFYHGCSQCFPSSKPRVRDSLIDLAAENIGWEVLRFWGHEIKTEAREMRQRILSKMQSVL